MNLSFVIQQAKLLGAFPVERRDEKLISWSLFSYALLCLLYSSLLGLGIYELTGKTKHWNMTFTQFLS